MNSVQRPHLLRRVSVAALSCAAIFVSLTGRAQVAPAAASNSGPSPAQPKSTEEVVALSPFEVVSDTRGYFSANTMSGTRFNTKLEDLASSLTVVSKEQMADFAMLDINDIFLY